MTKRVLALIVIALIAIPVMGVFAQDEGNIVEVAAGNEDFSTLVSLVEAAGLVDTLSGEGPFTVFAPTNEAFAALPEVVVEYLGSEAGADMLSRILTYHVVGAAVPSSDVTTGAVASVEGSDLDLIADDMGVMVNNATVVIPDVAASNGVIHAIDTVLVPPITLEVIPADVSGDIVIAGSSTVGPLTIALADRFAAEGYTGEISVAITGSGAGFERFCESGETDLSNASRAIRESEIEACGNLDPARSPIPFRVGTDAISVVVHPSNDFVDNVTFEQLALIFGDAETWADVDPSWPAEPILRFIPGTDSGTFDYFVEEIFPDDPEGTTMTEAEGVQPSEDDNVLVNGVAENEFAVGFFGFAYYADNQERLKILDIDGVEANAATVDAGEYPLARPLFVYGDRGIIEEKPQIGEFMKYYLENVNDVLISDVTAETAIVTDEEGNVIDYNISVAYFEANQYAVRVSKLWLKAITDLAMSM